MSVSVCLCVCVFSVRNQIFGTTRPIFTEFRVLVTYGRGSVLLCRVIHYVLPDDVIFAHKPRLLDVATQLKHSAHIIEVFLC